MKLDANLTIPQPPEAPSQAGLQFAVATEEDFDEIMAMSQDIYGGLDYLPTRYTSWLQETNRLVILARKEGKVVSSFNHAIYINIVWYLHRSAAYTTWRAPPRESNMLKAQRYYLNIDMFGKDLDLAQQQFLCHLQQHTASLKGHVMCQIFLDPGLWRPMADFCQNTLNVELVKEYTEQCVVESDLL
ncbi:PREDICTED: histidine N-acetyltransferase-like [Cyprinodon variegatus]|uniref:histidine N-acetyltransferase-like n=1 Tax=Cyprinodon variegatus TaxID=28743 RepID=UPI0007429034|nr:PREDICTED: histidine N-acetyltransferase-like [Cyprinodon variegatus]